VYAPAVVDVSSSANVAPAATIHGLELIGPKTVRTA
jgi:hypothetical protein